MMLQLDSALPWVAGVIAASKAEGMCTCMKSRSIASDWRTF
jgi:hypothetical protein